MKRVRKRKLGLKQVNTITLPVYVDPYGRKWIDVRNKSESNKMVMLNVHKDTEDSLLVFGGNVIRNPSGYTLGCDQVKKK